MASLYALPPVIPVPPWSLCPITFSPVIPALTDDLSIPVAANSLTLSTILTPPAPYWRQELLLNHYHSAT